MAMEEILKDAMEKIAKVIRDVAEKSKKISEDSACAAQQRFEELKKLAIQALLDRRKVKELLEFLLRNMSSEELYQLLHDKHVGVIDYGYGGYDVFAIETIVGTILVFREMETQSITVVTSINELKELEEELAEEARSSLVDGVEERLRNDFAKLATLLST